MFQRFTAWAGVGVLAGHLCGCAASATQTPPESPEQGPATPEVGAQPTAAERCEAQAFEVGRLRVSQRWVQNEEKCIVMVSADGQGDTSRSFLFNSQGMLLTFNNLGDGPASRSTGARTHFLLPNVQPLHLEREGAQVRVHTTSGHTVTFDADTGLPEGISQGVLKVSPKVTAKGGGGVELNAASGIVADFGFARGGSPHQKPEGRVTLTDGQGNTCTVGNKDLLAYDRDEPYLVVSSREELSSFLANGQEAQCSSLVLDDEQQ